MSMGARSFAFAGFGCALAVAVAIACGGGGGGGGAVSEPAADGGSTRDAVAAPDTGQPAIADAEAPPEILAQDLGTPWEIACDEGAAFVTYETDGGRGTLYRLEPGAGPAAIATEPVRARHTAVDATRVYWVGGSTGGHSYVHALEKTSDGGKRPEDYFDDGSGSRNFSFLAVREGGLVYAVHNESPVNARVMRGSTDGGDAITIAPASVLDVAFDGSVVYWISSDGAIRRARTATDGGDATMFLPGAGATSLTLAGGEAVFTSDDGQLRAASLADGATRVLATGLHLAREVAADAREVFWVDTETGTIAAVALAGGAPRTVATASPSSRIAVCANALWFTNPARRSVERVLRP